MRRVLHLRVTSSLWDADAAASLDYLDCFDWLAPAFGDSNEKDVHLDDPLLDNSDEGPGSMDQHSSPVIISYPPPLPPFDMVDIMHNASSCGMHEV